MEIRAYIFNCNECQEVFEWELEGEVDRRIWKKLQKDGVCEKCAKKLMED